MTRRPTLIPLGLLALLGSHLPLPAQGVSDADTREFQRIITSQLDAFTADDGAAAYGFAAPAINRLFPSPEIFMWSSRALLHFKPAFGMASARDRHWLFCSSRNAQFLSCGPLFLLYAASLWASA
jgi:hypothetical protein